MKRNVSKNISVNFEKIDDIDDRFMRFKIWIVNVGVNHNNSKFTKESIIKAIPTLYNTPILGYIEEDGAGNKDFRGHEMEIVVKDGNVKTHYLGSAYGTIPLDCNPKFEYRTNELGGTEEYLTVEAVMWTKFDDAVDIMKRDSAKHQSMELSEKYTGKWNEEGYFEFEEFQFFGCTILGEGVMPGIPQSTIEHLFTKHNIQKDIDEKMVEYSHIFEKHLNKNQFKEVTYMTLEELLNKYSLTVEALAEKGIVSEDFSVEELELKIQEAFEVTEDVEEVQAEVIEEVVEEVVEEATTENVEEEFENKTDDKVEGTQVNVADKYTRTFELSHEDIRWKMYEQLDNHMNAKGLDGWYYISSVYESYIVVEEESEKFYKVDYSKDGDNIILGEAVEVFGMFLTSEEKGALELMRANFEKYEKENEELKSFQSGVIKAQHEAEAETIFSNFTKLTEDDVKELKENIHDFTIEQIESKCFELLGRKTVSFTKKEAPASLKMNFSTTEDQPVKTGTDSIFAKHGIIK